MMFKIATNVIEKYNDDNKTFSNELNSNLNLLNPSKKYCERLKIFFLLKKVQSKPMKNINTNRRLFNWKKLPYKKTNIDIIPKPRNTDANKKSNRWL